MTLKILKCHQASPTCWDCLSIAPIYILGGNNSKQSSHWSISIMLITVISYLCHVLRLCCFQQFKEWHQRMFQKIRDYDSINQWNWGRPDFWTNTYVILVIIIDYLSHISNMEKSRKLFKTGICLKIPYIPTKNLLQYHYRKLCILHPFAGFPKNGGTPKIIHVIFGFSIIFISKYMMWSISGFCSFPSSYCGTPISRNCPAISSSAAGRTLESKPTLVSWDPRKSEDLAEGNIPSGKLT
jgi:hypothetical protein